MYCDNDEPETTVQEAADEPLRLYVEKLASLKQLR